MLQLLRLYEGANATLGVLVVDNYPFFTTLELPWRDNQKLKSCIPTGSYKCEQTTHPHYGLTYLVKDVPDRDGIYFHIGNTVIDTQGCILLGTIFGGSLKRPFIGESKAAMNRFRQQVTAETECLDIISTKRLRLS